MNKTILMGRLTKDPEVKYLQDENSTATLAAAAYLFLHTLLWARMNKRQGAKGKWKTKKKLWRN